MVLWGPNQYACDIHCMCKSSLTLFTASLVLCHIMNTGTMLGDPVTVYGELCGLLGGATLLAV